jgi:hypothetical protein
MPRRRSEGAKIVQFFTNAPLDQVNFVYDMVRDIAAERLKGLKPATKRAPRKQSVEPQAQQAQTGPK